jgi:hypothetical protein
MTKPGNRKALAAGVANRKIRLLMGFPQNEFMRKITTNATGRE